MSEQDPNIIYDAVRSFADNNDLDRINKYLSERGYNIDTKFYSNGDTLLSRAIIKNDITMIDSLILKGANVNIKNNDGFTAFHYAAMCGNKYIIRSILRTKPDINIQTKKGYTPLIYSAQQKNLESVQELIEHGADINILCTDGCYYYDAFDFLSDTELGELKLSLSTNGTKEDKSAITKIDKKINFRLKCEEKNLNIYELQLQEIENTCCRI